MGWCGEVSDWNTWQKMNETKAFVRRQSAYGDNTHPTRHHRVASLVLVKVASNETKTLPALLDLGELFVLHFEVKAKSSAGKWTNLTWFTAFGVRFDSSE